MSTEKLQTIIARKDKEFQILQTFAAEITSTLDLDQIFKIIFESMDEALGFKHSMILLYQEKDKMLKTIASHGYEESDIGARLPLGKGVIGTVAKHKKILRMNNLGFQRTYARAVKQQMQKNKKTSDDQGEIPLPGLKNVQSQLAIPLIVKDSLIGVLSVEDAESYIFDELDETLLSILGSQIASAIDNARLYKLEEDRVKELNAAYEELSELNQTLEDKVIQRTRELSKTLDDLKATQSQLIESEKMAALGNLVAGIVHEVNNPIGAIKSSTDVTQRCLDKIEKIIHEMKTSDEILGNRQYKKSVQILQSNVEVTLDASSRIVKIIDSLKNLIHLDEAERQQANINDGLENTLTLIRNEIGSDIKIVKEYGKIPEILCYPGQLNQVFINLLLNAIRAIRGQGVVTIKTYVENTSVCINISDTGIGISPDKLEKIFDLSFTDKDHRVGLGMGLSTVYSIIQKHQGNINVESTPGLGTTFLIEIPLTS